MCDYENHGSNTRFLLAQCHHFPADTILLCISKFLDFFSFVTNQQGGIPDCVAHKFDDVIRDAFAYQFGQRTDELMYLYVKIRNLPT